MSPAKTAPSENVVAAGLRLTEKLVTSTSGLTTPVKLGRKSLTGSATVAVCAIAGELTTIDNKAAASGILFIAFPRTRGPRLPMSVHQADSGSKVQSPPM